MRNIDLNGEWSFCYTADEEVTSGHIPQVKDFSAVMPIPGYWDDHLESLKRTKVWSRGVLFNPDYRKIDYPLGTGKPADTSLPYIIGTGWYRKEVYIEKDLEGDHILFCGGEAVTDFILFINRNFVYIHKNQMTGSQYYINDYLRYGEINEIIIAVSNFRRDIISTAYRGFKGFSAGIYGNVRIQARRCCMIEDVYAYSNPEMTSITIQTSLMKRSGDPVSVRWRFTDPAGQLVRSGELMADTDVISDICNAEDFVPWTDHNPYLYQLEVAVYAADMLCDRRLLHYGFRVAGTKQMHILLNNRRILLRGLTEHGYYPLTCTPPDDKKYYRSIVKKYKEIGFNWIRFHTTVPHQYYLEACDELGMLVQVEAPNNFKDEMWEGFLQKCRNHPSVILYCGGNEERLTDELIKRLEQAAQQQKEMVPDALFSPMQALPYVDWLLEEEVPIRKEPIPHNPEKLQWLKQFSDVFQPQKDIGFNKITAGWRTLDPLLSFYQKPYVSHEVGILDGYIDLDLENRYRNTRIGTSLYQGAREYLEKENLLHNAAYYYKNSCLWSAAIRKIFIEKLRLCDHTSGYDYLGAIDCHWHRTGYTPGILNEFHEYKPGEGKREILRYNGENVVLLDIPVERNFRCNTEVRFDAFASVYGKDEIGDAEFSWKLMVSDDRCLVRGKKRIGKIETCKKSALGEIVVAIPEVAQAMQCTLRICLESAHYEIENEYAVWVYPDNTLDTGEVLICEELDDMILERINDGLSVLFLSPNGLKTTPLSYTKMMAGRTVGNTATVIYDHPITERFPHQGWCDLQFYSMFEGGKAVVFDADSPLIFEPIIEIVSSYKTILKQSCLFEFSIGKGKVVVCTLNLKGTDPGMTALQQAIITYMSWEEFQPKHKLCWDEAQSFFHPDGQLNLDYSQETGLDGNAQFIRKESV